MKQFILIGLVASLFLGCTRKADTTNIKIETPFAPAIQNISAQSTGPSWNSSLNPSTLADINCYAVFVGADQPGLNQNTCQRTDTGEIKMRFGKWRALVPAGQEISLEVPSGPGRRIWLVGLKSQNGACTDVTNNGPDGINLSYPHILAFSEMNLGSGTVTVNLTRTLSSSNYFNDCSFIEGDNESKFGDGRDGNITLTSGTFYFGADGYNHGSASYSGTLSSTKRFSSNRRITSVDSTGKTLTLDSAFTADDFEADDEILWVVNASQDTALGPDSGCGTGSGLYRGIWRFARIVSTTGSTITLDYPISANPGNINLTNLNAGSALSSLNFCRMQVVRVPNFDTLTVSGASIINGPTYQMTGSSGSGGIVVIKVKNLVLNTTLSLAAWGRGFPGATFEDGHGLEGIGNVDSSPNSNGGGTTSGSGGGGSLGGAGGNGAGAPGGQGGVVPNFCGGAGCFIHRDNKIFFGGAGGGANTITGGSGGGAVILRAQNISGASNLSLIANGSPPSANSGGAGSGGTISLGVRTSSISSISMDAIGGNDGGNGGGGGGGLIEALYCDANIAAQLLTNKTGGSGYSPGADGQESLTTNTQYCGN